MAEPLKQPEESFITIRFRGPKDVELTAFDFGGIGAAHVTLAAAVLAEVGLTLRTPFVLKTLRAIEQGAIVRPGRRVL